MNKERTSIDMEDTMEKLPSFMTREEYIAQLDASDAALRAGDEEGAMRILMQETPLVPRMACVAKAAFGVEGMKERGYDLRWAIEEYGEGWLSE
jgi:hypothetical protein